MAATRIIRRSMQLSDKEYCPIALMFSNEAHITGEVLVDSFTLYYYGLNAKIKLGIEKTINNRTK